MDPFSISLGILQVTGTALKLSLLIYDKLKTFRHYSREVKRILKGFERQRKNFIHEIHIILQHAEQCEPGIEEMLENQEHPRWRSTELQVVLTKSFPKNLKDIEETVEEIGSSLRSLQDELLCFNAFYGAHDKDRSEPLQSAVRRLRDKVIVTFNKSKFEQQIESLRQLNKDLRRLRKQEFELKQIDVSLIGHVYPSKRLSPEFGSIGKVRRASRAFHRALATAWLASLNPASSAHSKHNVKLLLNAQVQEHVAMEVIISCYKHCLSPVNTMQISLVRLHVESRVVLGSSPSGLQTPPDSSDERRKKRRVRFAVDVERTIEDVPAASTPEEFEVTNLQGVECICATLHDQTRCCRPSRCIGFLESCADETFRHSFFQSPGDPAQAPITESLCLSMRDILVHQVETSVTVVDQFKLARNFAMAVLKFYSTPWLQEYFSIGDLSFMKIGEEGDISSCLQTAHLSLDFIQPSPGDVPCMAMEDACSNEIAEDAKLFNGVRNLTLWSLGAAMLQIESWSAIEALDDVIKVRRMAQRPAVIGKRYRALAKQCLDCDFGFGDDLSKPRLQQAVYETVICGLTDMIDRLSIE